MSEDKQIQLLRIAAVLSLMLAVVNHLLPPKAFAATQLLFDYHMGLTRRGLTGSFLNVLAGPVFSVAKIYLVAALVTLTGALAFYGFLARYLQRHVAGMLLLILALNSFAFASFVGNSGYLDALLLALALLAMSTNGRHATGVLARMIACGIGVFLHENMLPYFAILLSLELWLSRGGNVRNLGLAMVPVATGIGALLILLLFGQLTATQTEVFASHIQAKAAFGLDANSTIVASRSITENLALMSELRGTTKYWGWVVFDGVPLLAMSLWLLWLSNRLLVSPSRLMQAFLAVAILAPLSLNVIAFDVVRFGVASVLAGFVALVVILRSDPDSFKRLAATLTWPHFLILIVLNANIFTIGVNIGGGHTSQFPWVLLTQLQWLAH